MATQLAAHTLLCLVFNNRSTDVVQSLEVTLSPLASGFTKLMGTCPVRPVSGTTIFAINALKRIREKTTQPTFQYFIMQPAFCTGVEDNHGCVRFKRT